MYEKIKSYYERGLWSKQQVLNVVAKGVLTMAEAQEIVGAE